MTVSIGALAKVGALAVTLPRLARAARMRPAITSSGDTESFAGTISVVVPARNEASRLKPLLDSVVGAPDVTEVIVVDDESTDDTPTIATEAGARLVAVGLRPDGWAGKTWALQRGLEEATGEWIVMLDADTRPHPRLPGALVARAWADESDLLTAAGRFVGESHGARWLHAAMLTTLVYRFGPPGQQPSQQSARILANGQCMAVRREVMMASGGFASVSGSVVEDVALARHLSGAGKRVDFLDASDLLAVEMYPSLTETWTGWGRSIGLPGVDPLARRLFDLAVLTLALPVPLARLVLGRPDPIDLIAVAARLGTLVGTRTAFARNDTSYWLSPLADGLAIAALARALLPGPTTWSARTYP